MASLHLDPVEKNPLFHIRPGERCLALGTAGCNMSCQVCQNWQLSQQGVEGVPNNLFLPPERVVSLALERKVKALCYTYTEPAVAYEFVTDTAALARAQGLRNYLVTGGYINPAPALQLGRAVDAVSVSLKALNDASLEAIRQAALEQGLKYFCVDNVVGHEGNNTYCPKCHKLLVQRLGLKVLGNTLHAGRCPDCHTSIAGLWA